MGIQARKLPTKELRDVLHDGLPGDSRIKFGGHSRLKKDVVRCQASPRIGSPCEGARATAIVVPATHDVSSFRTFCQ